VVNLTIEMQEYKCPNNNEDVIVTLQDTIIVFSRQSKTLNIIPNYKVSAYRLVKG